MKRITGFLAIVAALFLCAGSAMAQDADLQTSQRFMDAQDKHNGITQSMLNYLSQEEGRAMMEAQNKWAQSEWPKLIQENLAKGMNRVEAYSQPLEEYNNKLMNELIGYARKKVESMRVHGNFAREKLDELFANTHAMHDHARSLTFADGQSAQQLLLNSWKNLQKSAEQTDESKKLSDGMQAWFDAVYARYAKEAEEKGKELGDAAKREYNAAIMRSANWLGIPKGQLVERINQTLEYLKGRRPDNCGYAMGAISLSENLSMLVIDNGAGKIRRLYFDPRNPANNQCAALKGSMCFRVVGAAPVTPQLSDAGITASELPIVQDCGAVD